MLINKQRIKNIVNRYYQEVYDNKEKLQYKYLKKM